MSPADCHCKSVTSDCRHFRLTAGLYRARARARFGHGNHLRPKIRPKNTKGERILARVQKTASSNTSKVHRRRDAPARARRPRARAFRRGDKHRRGGRLLPRREPRPRRRLLAGRGSPAQPPRAPILPAPAPTTEPSAGRARVHRRQEGDVRLARAVLLRSDVPPDQGALALRLRVHVQVPHAQGDEDVAAAAQPPAERANAAAAEPAA